MPVIPASWFLFTDNGSVKCHGVSSVLWLIWDPIYCKHSSEQWRPHVDATWALYDGTGRCPVIWWELEITSEDHICSTGIHVMSKEDGEALPFGGWRFTRGHWQGSHMRGGPRWVAIYNVRNNSYFWQQRHFLQNQRNFSAFGYKMLIDLIQDLITPVDVISPLSLREPRSHPSFYFIFKFNFIFTFTFSPFLPSSLESKKNKIPD